MSAAQPSRVRRPTLHLIDASPYVFRAWFSVPDSLTAPDGRAVNAVFGFAGFLLRYLAEERPTHLALAFDRSLDSRYSATSYAIYTLLDPWTSPIPIGTNAQVQLDITMVVPANPALVGLQYSFVGAIVDPVYSFAFSNRAVMTVQ